jgi:hypothetical protein
MKRKKLLELDETERLFDAMCARLDFLDKVEMHRAVDDGGWIAATGWVVATPGRSEVFGDTADEAMLNFEKIVSKQQANPLRGL